MAVSLLPLHHIKLATSESAILMSFSTAAACHRVGLQQDFAEGSSLRNPHPGGHWYDARCMFVSVLSLASDLSSVQP